MKAVPLNRYITFLVIVALGVSADLVSKSWMFAELDLPGGRTWWLWTDVFGFQTSLNPGALFGMGQGKVFLFALLSIVALAGILVWLFVFSAARDRFLTITLGCITAGILGNLYDRLAMHGLCWPVDVAGHAAGEPIYAVRDWILIRFGSWDWPNFNVADSLLVCGAILLVWHAYRTGDRGQDTGDRGQKSDDSTKKLDSNY